MVLQGSLWHSKHMWLWCAPKMLCSPVLVSLADSKLVDLTVARLYVYLYKTLCVVMYVVIIQYVICVRIINPTVREADLMSAQSCGL